MRFHSRQLSTTPYSRRGTGDLVPGATLEPWNPFIRGMGDLGSSGLIFVNGKTCPPGYATNGTSVNNGGVYTLCAPLPSPVPRPVIRRAISGMGDLTPSALLTPWNPFAPRAGMGGLGCASCSTCNNGMGDLSTVGTDLSAGNFSQAWTDLQTYMSQLFGTTVGPYVIPAAGLGIIALAVTGHSKRKRGR